MKSYIAATYLWVFSVFFSFLSARIDFSRLSLVYFFTDILPLLCSFYFLLFGFSPARQVLVFLSVFLSMVISFPLMPNHRYVMLFGMLLLLIPQICNAQNRDSYFSIRTVPAVRALLVIVYFFACVVKLNYAYLDPERSCASLFYSHIVQLNSFLPSAMYFDYLAIFGSIVVEAILPILFVFGYYRSGLILGVIFHFVLSLDLYKYFTNFSSVMFFLLFVSSGSSILARFHAFTEEAMHKMIPSLRMRRVVLVFFLLIFCVLFASPEFLSEDMSMHVLFIFVSFRHALWFMYVFFILLFCIHICTGKAEVEGKQSVIQERRLFSLELILLVCAFINGLTPFLGVKTRTGFNMYSNLRIEPDFSNHLIIEKSLGLGGYLTDTGIVRGEPDDMYCNRVLYGQTQYPIFEILRAARVCSTDPFTFIYDDIEFVSNSREVHELISVKTSALERMFLTFKPIGLKAENECIW